MQSLAGEKASLLQLWEERRGQFEQSMELQLFMRDAYQADNWMAMQEVSYSNTHVYGWEDKIDGMISLHSLS